MILSGNQGRRGTWWQWAVDRWNRTPGYLKWIGGILLGALARVLLEKLFPEAWDRISHPTIPLWLAVLGLIAVLMLERTMPPLYRRLRARGDQVRLRPLFGVRWATPPDVDHVQGPYCAVCTVPLRGTLWSGDSSPTLWACPSCGREFTTPEFPDIKQEVERALGGVHQPSA